MGRCVRNNDTSASIGLDTFSIRCACWHNDGCALAIGDVNLSIKVVEMCPHRRVGACEVSRRLFICVPLHQKVKDLALARREMRNRLRCGCAVVRGVFVKPWIAALLGPALVAAAYSHAAGANAGKAYYSAGQAAQGATLYAQSCSRSVQSTRSCQRRCPQARREAWPPQHTRQSWRLYSSRTGILPAPNRCRHRSRNRLRRRSNRQVRSAFTF